jgi:hypothetical protein
MKKYILLISCLYSNSVFITSLPAQVPGSWDTYIVCTKCSYVWPLHDIPEWLDFADPDHGILIGDNYEYKDGNGYIYTTSRVYLTSDGGVSWVQHTDTTSFVHFGLSGLNFFNYPTQDFAAGFIGSNYVSTTNQGSNWNYIRDFTRDKSFEFLCGKVYSPSTSYKFIWQFRNDSNPGNLPVYIERSVDSGQTFLVINDTLASGNLRFYNAYMQDSLNIWAIVKDTISPGFSCLHTLDGGLHWSRFFPIDTTNGGGLFYPGSMFGNDEKGVFYLVNSYDLLFTTDAGATWNAGSSNHGRLAQVVNSGGSNLWGLIGRRNNQNNRMQCDTLAYSPNNGKNWFYDGNVIRGDSVELMVWKDSTHGYIISYADSVIWFSKYIPPPSSVNAIIHMENSGIYFHVTPTITSDIIHLTAYQPFNGAISVYDVLGRLFLQKSLNFADGEEKEFSLSRLSSGIYFLTFSGGGKYSSARIIKE